MTDPALLRIRAVAAANARSARRLQLLCAGGGAALAVASYLLDMPVQAIISVVLFGGLAVGIDGLRRRYADPAASPVLDALYEHPERVTWIEQGQAMPTQPGRRIVVVHLDSHALPLTVADNDVDDFVALLAARCPNATVKRGP